MILLYEEALNKEGDSILRLYTYTKASNSAFTILSDSNEPFY